MPGHRPGVAQAQIDVVVTVNTREMPAVRLLDDHREAAGPLGHPVHRHAADEGMPRAFEEAARARMRAHERNPFALHEVRQALPRYAAHRPFRDSRADHRRRLGVEFEVVTVVAASPIGQASCLGHHCSMVQPSLAFGMRRVLPPGTDIRARFTRNPVPI